MVTVGIASIPARKDSLITVVTSVKDQCDKVYVALNNYTEIPSELLAMPNVECGLFDNSLGDAMKFWKVGEVEGYYLSIDDDLVYPDSYVSDMIEKIKEYNCIVTLHGRQFKIRPIKSFRRSATLNFHCLYHKSLDVKLDIGGTGVMGFDTQRFRLSIDDFPLPNMADIFVGKKAFQQGVPIMGIRHQAGYLKYLSPTETIWLSSRDDTIQTKILNSFLK
jgi:hypothetical protein